MLVNNGDLQVGSFKPIEKYAHQNENHCPKDRGEHNKNL